jgi:oligopeptide transport system ATP-binding protein
MSGRPLLEVTELEVSFPVARGTWPFRRTDRLRAVDRVSLTVAAGETLGIVGESGCGKSTLGRAILRLIDAQAGQILWLGRDLRKLDKRGLRGVRRDLQIVFQDPLASLDPRMTVGQSIAEPLRTADRGYSRDERQRRVDETMRLVGLSPALAGRYPHELSGGQCQRVGIARAMIVRPKLIVCDEPVSALDVSIQAQILNLLRYLQARFGLALILISHDLAVIRHLCQRVLVLYLGRVVESAGREQLFERPRHPYTRALLSAVPVPDPVLERQRQRIVLRGDLPSPLDPPSGCAFRTRCRHAESRCAERRPELEPIAPGHEVACLRWAELDPPVG